MTRVAGIGVLAGLLSTAATVVPGLRRTRDEQAPIGDAMRALDDPRESRAPWRKQRSVNLLLNVVAGVLWASLAEMAASRFGRPGGSTEGPRNAASSTRRYGRDDQFVSRSDGPRDQREPPEALAVGLVVLKATLAVAELLRRRRHL